jgi:multidrug resistance protein
MTTPTSLPDVARDAQDQQSGQTKDAHQQAHDTDPKSAEDAFYRDLEKDVECQAQSTHTDERTLSASNEAEEDQARDPNIINWDGPDDPKNPQNWPAAKKWRIVFATSLITLITPIGSSFFAPGVPQVMKAFHEHSRLMASFVVSVYILGFAIGPLVIAPMSELYGRMHVNNISNVLFVIFSIGCALSDSMGMLVGFRFLAGCAGAAPLTLGGGMIADMFPIEQRAGAMAIWSIGPLLGPVAGPIAGGFLVQNLVWRWVYWILAIFAGAFSIFMYIVGSETYHPVLLARKTKALIKSTGNPNLRSALASDLPPKEIFIRAIVRPIKLLTFSPIVALMCSYIAVNYGILYLFFTTITFVFEGQYHFSSGSVGLCYLGLGIGMIIGLGMSAAISDREIVKQKAKGLQPKPEHRLPLLLTMPGAIGLPIGIFVYGWTTKNHVHWIVPIIFMAPVGLGVLTSLMTVQTYLVDTFTIYAASVIAANTVLRSLFGCVLPLAGLPMFDSLGLGWGNSLLGFIALAFVPVPVLFRYYGESIRTNPRFQVKL